MDDGIDSVQVITTLDEGCVVGIGCKVHTHHYTIHIEPQIVYQSMEKFTIFGKNYCTNQWGQTYELPSIEPVPEPILMQQTYASDTITPTTSAFLLAPKPEQKIIIKPRTDFAEYKATMDAPVMGMLLTFTIYLTAQWAWSSMSAWLNLCSELKQCLRFSS
jgi:hypothetical protein